MQPCNFRIRIRIRAFSRCQAISSWVKDKKVLSVQDFCAHKSLSSVCFLLSDKAGF